MGTQNDIVAVAAVRTPIGSFGGTLRDVPAYDLGAAAIRAVIERGRIDASLIDKVIYGNCRQAGNGPNPARTAAIRGGLSLTSPVMTVNMACPSGIKTVMLAARELQAGGANFILAGGMESMSTMPYLLKGARWEGFKAGDKTLMDSWSDTIDPLCGYGMGVTAENQSAKYDISRAQQDEFALQSQLRAAAAQEAGFFKDEIVPFRLEPDRKHPEGVLFTQDEGWRSDTTVEKLAKLRPVFKKDGTVTAVQPAGRFGALDMNGTKVRAFQEKPQGDGAWINGGFFVCSPKVLDVIDGDATLWEREPLEILASRGQLSAYLHHGFWQPMDMLRDKQLLESHWESGRAPWRVW